MFALGLTYIPYFSNCRGSDSQISISRLIEDNPMCTLIQYDNTVPVDPYFWNAIFTPTSGKILNFYNFNLTH